MKMILFYYILLHHNHHDDTLIIQFQSATERQTLRRSKEFQGKSIFTIYFIPRIKRL